MPVKEFYQNCKPCSGIFAENGDPKGRHVPDWSNIEVHPWAFSLPKTIVFSLCSFERRCQDC